MTVTREKEGNGDFTFYKTKKKDRPRLGKLKTSLKPALKDMTNASSERPLCSNLYIDQEVLFQLF